MSHLVDGRKPSRFQLLRETVARAWALSAIGRLAADTSAMGKRWSSDCYGLDRDPCEYIAAMPAAPSDPYTYTAPDGEGPRVSLAALSAERHASWVRRRYALADQAALTRAIYRDGNLSPVLHRETHPSLYCAADPVYGYAACTGTINRGVLIRSTTYTREVSYAVMDGEDGPETLTRVVEWVPADDPMTEALANGRDPLSVRMLERAADALIREADAAEHHAATLFAMADGRVNDDAVPSVPRLVRLDVIDPYTRRPTVSPDPVAHRGVVRYRRPSPVRYSISKPHTVLTYPFDMTSPDDAIAADNALGTVPRATTVALYRTDIIGANRAEIGCTGRGWQGFKITTGESARMARKLANRRKRTAVKRGESVGTRGLARTGWNLSERSLPRAWARADAGQVAVAEVIGELLAVFDHGRPIELGRDHYVIVDTATVARCDASGELVTQHYPHRQYAKRAALARMDVA